ncbi:hypothetical protein RIF29_21025 [Crotalaria pallida]|uniref:Endonuclease/exonuclease/phosphatase domain-containing protein n=1 Tax=Crotalaria pallida TaxID=3830 RepID=A0AAN9I6U8_CROPI
MTQRKEPTRQRTTTNQIPDPLEGQDDSISNLLADSHIRSWGRVKKKAINDLVRKNKVDFLAIQESKKEEVTRAVVSWLWTDVDFDWDYVPSSSRSRGIISIWRSAKFLKSNVIRAFVIKERLKLLKNALRVWNKEVFGNINEKLAAITAGIEAIDFLGESSSLSHS